MFTLREDTAQLAQCESISTKMRAAVVSPLCNNKSFPNLKFLKPFSSANFRISLFGESPPFERIFSFPDSDSDDYLDYDSDVYYGYDSDDF
jgi:hypothetical protein